jgi:hypothetical protein
MTASTHPDVERLRRRLNTLILVLPGQWLPLTALYWMRFLRPFRPHDLAVPDSCGVVFVSAVVLSLVPFLLPTAWFRPRPLERGRLYPALGLRVFRFVATDGDWVLRRLRRRDPGFRVVRDRATRAGHVAAGITNERWHSSWFLFGAVTQTFAFATGEYGWGFVLSVLNVAFNLLPVLHQRYKRARLRSPVEALEARGSDRVVLERSSWPDGGTG